MKPRPDCLPCILHQALQVARQVSDDEWSQRKLLNEVLRVLPEAEWHQSNPAEVLGEAIATARDTLKVKHPYRDRRQEAQRVFRGLADGFRERLAASEDPFALATTAAAAANLVDELVFPRFARSEPRAIFEAALEAGFASGSPAQLRESVERAQAVLYLLDNAGEVCFDALLIEQIRALGKRVRVVVRGGGLLHDATREDAEEVGLTEGERPLTESGELEAMAAARAAAKAAEDQAGDEAAQTDADAPAPAPLTESGEMAIGPPGGYGPDLIELGYGVLALRTVSRGSEIGEALAAADLVIAKGSAYYQALGGLDVEVVHLLRAKCPPVAHSLGVSPGNLVLLRVPPKS